MFLDGWGYAREDKVLYLTIVRCRYLNAMDLTSSDPYCEIRCNGIALQSSVKWTNLNPEYHESFELDVTNPAALLTIVVMDKDYFGSDDFMGQVQIELSEFADGVEREKV
jgi:Ca2+-dependent lipid-binding protein